MVSHSLIAEGAVRVRVPLYLGLSWWKAHPSPFAALAFPNSKKVPIYCWLTERVFQLPHGEAQPRTHNLYGDFLHRNQAALITRPQCPSGAGCSKLTTSLVNVSLKFQMLISQIHQYFLLKKCEKLLLCKSFSHFCNKKFQCIWL